MLGNCEKMVLIPSAPNEWAQNTQIDVQKGGCLNTKINNMGSAGSGRVMDNQKIAEIAQEHQQKQQNQEPLRCPRCDSTNTKFCYYNNYSLSQPRHFCKACKRYWTRGGTLRNVPVGGGCRKNKRVKRPSNSSSSSSLTNSNLIDANSANSASSNGHVSPLFYGSDINFPFSRYDLQNPPQINGIGLGFSPSSSGLIHNMNGDGGFSTVPASKQIFQDLMSSNPLLSNYTSSSPTISSLFGSSLQIKGENNFQTLLPSYDHQNDLQMKEVKMELEGQNRSIDHHWSAPSQNQMDQTIGSSSDPVLWGGGVNNLGAWLDPSNNIGSSVPSLI